jgi:hypothetical protein
MCSLFIECALFIRNIARIEQMRQNVLPLYAICVLSLYRMCSLFIECALSVWNVFSLYGTSLERSRQGREEELQKRRTKDESARTYE